MLYGGTGAEHTCAQVEGSDVRIEPKVWSMVGTSEGVGEWIHYADGHTGLHHHIQQVVVIIN